MAVDMKDDPEKHHRRSIRLKGYDYSRAGAYFVTICTQNRECLFGDIVDGEMMLNKNGEIVESVWNDLPNHYAHVELDYHIIMPNHIHGIIIIVGAGLKPTPPDTEKTHVLPEIICVFKKFSVCRIKHVIPTGVNPGNIIIMNPLCAMKTN